MRTRAACSSTFTRPIFAGAPGVGTPYVVLAYEARINARRLAPQGRQHRWFAPSDLRAADGVHPYAKAYFFD